MKLKLYFFALAMAFFATAYAADNDTDNISLIEQTLGNYIEGTSYNDSAKIEQAFSKDAQLLLENKEQAIWQVGVSEYASWFKKEPDYPLSSASFNNL